MGKITKRVRQMLQYVGHADQIEAACPGFFQLFQRRKDRQPGLAGADTVRFSRFDSNGLAVELLLRLPL